MAFNGFSVGSCINGKVLVTHQKTFVDILLVINFTVKMIEAVETLAKRYPISQEPSFHCAQSIVAVNELVHV